MLKPQRPRASQQAGGAFLLSFLIALGVLHPTSVHAAVMPVLPQTLIDTTPVPPTGATIAVAAGGDFQAALNAAQPGDVITLQAGASFTGSFTLPVKSGAGWITVRTSAPDTSLPPYGTRITPAFASALPKIITNSTNPALTTAPGAHHYRFVGVEVTASSSLSMTYVLVNLGDGSATQQSLSQVPYTLIFDRVYVHGSSTLNLQRAFAFNSATTAVVDSYIADVHHSSADSQGIAGWNGPGPFKIVNNYLEASTENVLFGGADPFIPNLVPSDIEIRGNYINKPTAWKTSNWTVKNLLELKNARRVLLDGNLFEHNWLQAQTGFAILFTVRNQGGTAPWSTVSDVTFTHNVVRHTGSGLNVLGQDDIYSSQQEQRILIQNNLFDDVNAATWGGAGRLFQVLNGAADLTIDHNTGFQSNEFLVVSELPQVRFTYTNNVQPNNQYGLMGDGCIGAPCIPIFMPGALITGNAIVGGNASVYPAGNFFPVTMSAVGFVDLTNGIYQLSASSPYRNAGTDGRDLGVDWPALTSAVSGASNGNMTGGGDTTAPTVSMVAPSSGATVSGTVLVSVTATDAGGVAQVVVGLDGASIATLFTAPYQVSWDTTKSANGVHTLSATATDTAGNQGASAPVTVTVSNGSPPPTLTVTGVGSSGITSSSADIGWLTNLPADSQVQYGTTTTYSSVTQFAPARVTVHAQTISGLASSTHYHYRVLSTSADGQSVVSGDFTFTTAAASKSAVPVTWTSLVNTTATGGGSIQKTGGCDGCQDAGAVSTQTLSADGYVEFTVGQTTTEREIGLSHGNPGTTLAGINFGLLLFPGGEIDVRENGVYRMNTTAAVKDTFRVAVAAGKVVYSKNGKAFYTSTVAPVYPLLIDTSFLTASGTLTSVVTTAPTPAMGAGPTAVTWASLVNVTDTGGGSIQKTSGCDGCEDAGAVSTQMLSGDGYVEFTVGPVTTEREIGLSHGNPGTTLAEINFGLLLFPGGEIDVREGGVYRMDTVAAAADKFRVSVVSGKVLYSKNGVTFYTSTVAPVYPLLVDTSFLTASSTLTGTVLSGGK